jgi:hypothetical protein
MTAAGKDSDVTIAVHFKHHGFTPEKYDEAISRLDAAGKGNPDGRLYHTALEADGEIEVFDIWESQEKLQAFGETGFIPILTEQGVEIHPPTVWPVRNTIQG